MRGASTSWRSMFVTHRRYDNGLFSMPKTDSFYFGERSFLMRE